MRDEKTIKDMVDYLNTRINERMKRLEETWEFDKHNIKTTIREAELTSNAIEKMKRERDALEWVLGKDV